MTLSTRQKNTLKENSASPDGERLFAGRHQVLVAYIVFGVISFLLGLGVLEAGFFFYDYFLFPKATAYTAATLLASLLGIIFLYRFISIALRRLHTAEEVITTLRGSKERFALAIAGASEGVWDWDIATNNFYVSAQWKKLLDIGENDTVTRRDWEERIHPDDKNTVEKAITYHLERNAAFYTAEYRVKTRAGAYKWFLDRGKASWNPAGKPVRMVGASRDITNIKNVEEVLKSKTAELERAKGKIEEEVRNTKKFQQAVAAATDAITIMIPTGAIVYANPSWEVLTGYAFAEAEGKNFAFPYAEKTPREILAKLWETVKNGTPFVSEEMVGKRADGSEYKAEVSVYPIVESGRTIFYTALEQDITKRFEVDKAKTEFVSLASHQLRTPLSAIRWYSEMLLAGSAGALNETQEKYVKEVYAASRRMIELVGALLNVSRIDLGTFAIDPKPTDLRELSIGAIKELEHQIAVKKLILREEYAKDLPILNVDPALMRMVFQNLISNAVKYTPDNGTITIALGLRGDNILISVVDNGYGIPKEQQDKIFSKLFRADNAREVDPSGTGLGLYIAKAIMEKSGGSIRFESEEGKGTAFYGILPLRGSPGRGGTKQLE